MAKDADAFRTIGEVAEALGLPQHVLRFWETRFPQIHPLKRGGGRRYYRPDDIVLLSSIKRLLYNEGYTLKGVQRLLNGRGRASVTQIPGFEIAKPQIATAPGFDKTRTPPSSHATSDGPLSKPSGEGVAFPPDPKADTLARLVQELETCVDILAAARRSVERASA